MTGYFFNVLLLLIGLMNNALALPWFHPNNDLRNNSKLQFKARDAITGSQINFSGQWVGRCDNSPTLDLTIKHTQDQISISYGFMEERYVLGEVRSATSSRLSISENSNTTVGWNTDNTALIFIHHNLFSNENGQLNVFFSKVSMSLQEEQLVVYGQHFYTGSNVDDFKQETISCVYDPK